MTFAEGRLKWLLWLAAVVILALLLWAAWQTGRARAWRMLLTNFLYFGSLSAGMVVWAAITMASRAHWTSQLKRTALVAIGFAPISLLMLLALMAAGSRWIPWLNDPTLHNRAWLNLPFMSTRDIVALCIFWLLAVAFIVRSHDGRPMKLAGWLIFIYSVVFSLIGFDLVMSLDPHWKSTLLGGYFFISGLYIGAAGWAMTTILQHGRSIAPARYRDMANLILAFSLLTTYMMFAQLLVQWYENLPHETRFMVPRMNPITRWPGISAVLLGTVYLGPLVLFLIPALKRTPLGLGVVAGLVLVFMWIERWWLVMPTLGEPLGFGLADAAVTVACLAAFVLCILALQWLWPDRFVISELDPAERRDGAGE
jgi:hypothetical protein